MTQDWALRILEDGFGRVREGVEHALLGLSADQIAARPGPKANSIGWIVWHLSRIVDDHFAGLAAVLAGAEPPRGRGHTVPPGQLWPEWRPRLGTPYPEGSTGYGHSSDEVAAFPHVTAELLAGYHAAVHARSIEILRGLRVGDFETIVDYRWSPPVTAGVRLVSILNDATQHVGQAAYVRGLVVGR
ncbi:DinB family protein [Sinomonas sp. ASV322]|uniref:mycothiol transferase n=1 Tax=Sinomonas sp. ASV322 TaxID=3041920 RepID=UPI0027DDAB37|nr:DinB family protein [Sinomonas sp. ASV322]MDQ4501893.1 DUF664 domain-containing protein [Sinomonas sp. ASV322]